MSTWRTIANRLVIVSLVILAGAFISATLVRYAPGFGTDEQQLDARLSRESIQALRSESSAERNVASYYVGWLRRTLRGDLGASRSMGRPVAQLLIERAGTTLRIVAKSLAIAWIAAVSLVVATWTVHSTPLEKTCTMASGLLLCLPVGAIALLLILLNGPGYLALVAIVFSKVHRYLSELVGATGGMSHIVAARAKGISELRLLFWHVIPVIRREVLALAGVSIALAVNAAIPVEALCGIPGIGQLAWHSALARDLPVLLNVSVLVIAFTVLANSGADLVAEEGRRTA
jgi:peptide/nickel transport system permease protein